MERFNRHEARDINVKAFTETLVQSSQEKLDSNTISLTHCALRLVS